MSNQNMKSWSELIACTFVEFQNKKKLLLSDLHLFIYRTRVIISHGLYFIHPIFHCSLYCRAANISQFFYGIVSIRNHLHIAIKNRRCVPFANNLKKLILNPFLITTCVSRSKIHAAVLLLMKYKQSKVDFVVLLLIKYKQLKVDT